MANNAVKSAGTKLEIKVGNAYVEVKGFKGFSGLGGGSASVIDVTDLNSGSKEKLMGIPDEGSTNITLIYLPADPGQLAMIASRAAQALSEFKITYSNTHKVDFKAFVLNFERSGEMDSALMASSTLEISGTTATTAGV